MHKPLAAEEPINQPTIHPSPRRTLLPPFFPLPSTKSECCHYVLASPQSLFSVSSRRRRHSRSSTLIHREAGTPAFPGFLCPPRREGAAVRRDVRAHPALALALALRRGVNDW